MTGASRFLLARLAQTAVVALVVGGLCFALMRVLPGDAAMRIAAGVLPQSSWTFRPIAPARISAPFAIAAGRYVVPMVAFAPVRQP